MGPLRFIWKYLAPESWVLRDAAFAAVALTVILISDFSLMRTTGPEVAFILVSTLTILMAVFVLVSRLAFHWTGRLARHVCRFRTASSARITLFYAAELKDSLDLPCVFDRYHRELVYLTQRFGMELAAPVGVFLFAATRDISKVSRTDFVAHALTRCNAIVVAAGADTQELIRHEFTHLFSAQWNESVHPLLSEGLSVWMQGTAGGLSVDAAATTAMHDKSLTLDRLLTSPGLFREPGCRRYSCYLLSGSFTGFLIRHCGWERYRRFYCAVGANNFRATFKQCLGLSFEIAESRWRRQVVVHNT